MAKVALSQQDEYTLVHKEQSIYGWPVRDASGKELGRIKEMIVDTDQERIATIVLDTGAQYDTRDITLADDVVLLNPATAAGQATGAALTGAATSAAVATAAPTTGIIKDREEMRLPVIEERLRVGKQQVDQGGVRVTSHVTERPVTEQVTLREVEVNVQRRPVNKLVNDAVLDTAREAHVDILAHGEEAVVSKQARVVEEVTVRKDVGQHTETVTETLRRSDVKVEEVAPARPGAPRPQS